MGCGPGASRRVIQPSPGVDGRVRCRDATEPGTQARAQSSATGAFAFTRPAELTVWL